MSSFISNINWLDIFVLTLLLRTSYIGLRRGFVAEFFKGLGVFLGLVISLHYYYRVSCFICKYTHMSPDFAEFLACLSLSLLIILAFKFIRDAILFLFKIEPKSFLDKSGGIILGLLRAILIISLILFNLNLARINYFKKSIAESLTGSRLIKVGPNIYEWSFENFIRLFFPGEELNKAVFESLAEEEKPPIKTYKK